MDTLRAIGILIVDSIFPRRCVGCGAEHESVCIRCLSRAPLASRNGTIDNDILSVFDYKDSRIRTAIWFLKYRRHKSIALNLGRMLYEFLIDEISEREAFIHFTNPILIPIPSAAKRMRSRGFNQAELLAQAIVRCDHAQQFALDTRALAKIIHTIPQAKIRDKKRRLTNLRGAFSVIEPERIHGRNIILIDDVATTGATISEAKRVLKKAGAKKIIGVTVAH